jgi:hypothetical protein
MQDSSAYWFQPPLANGNFATVLAEHYIGEEDTAIFPPSGSQALP